MANGAAGVGSLSSGALLAATKELAGKVQVLEADLLVHLAEIDERKLYLDRAHSSMVAFCVAELGFSEAAAYDRIAVARAGRKLAAIFDAVRSGRVHLTGLRLLVPHLTEKNHRKLLAKAAGRSKREIEELVARLAPREPVSAMVRRLSARRVVFVTAHTRAPPSAGASAPGTSSGAQPRKEVEAVGRIVHPRPTVVPLAADLFEIRFTASRAVRDKLREATELLRHRVPDGDMDSILGRALDLLIASVKKKRFAVGRKAKPGRPLAARQTESRHIPDAIKRAVYKRDGGRCTFRDGRGRRCSSTDALQFEHEEGFARTRTHSIEGIRLVCRPHNQHLANKMYGRAFMEKARARAKARRTRAGTSRGPAPPK